MTEDYTKRVNGDKMDTYVTEHQKRDHGSRGKLPIMGRFIISYQEVLHSLLKNVNHQADEAILKIMV